MIEISDRDAWAIVDLLERLIDGDCFTSGEDWARMFVLYLRAELDPLDPPASFATLHQDSARVEFDAGP
jgi:hypothetical protein